MKLMSNMKKMFLVFALTLGMSLSLVSAKPRQDAPVQATAVVEVQTVGGQADGCAAGIGLAAGLALSAFSPCSVVCLGLAWYTLLGTTAFACD